MTQAHDHLPDIPALMGPTASGKTFIALELATRYPIEVISVDSRQVYRYMDIGTAKPTKEERSRLPHHCIDLVTPDQHYSAGHFVEDALVAVKDILARGKYPLLVGGTGMYLYALEAGLFETVISEEVRKELRRKATEEGLQSLYQHLKKVDPESAARIHPNDRQRIIRALEVFFSTGVPISRLQSENTVKKFPFPIQKLILFPDRAFLYHRINERVQSMVEAGLIDEVKQLLEMGYTASDPGMKTFGYSEVISYLEEKISIGDMIDQIQKNTRRYAKRQFTWFRKYGGKRLISYGTNDWNLVLKSVTEELSVIFQERGNR